MDHTASTFFNTALFNDKNSRSRFIVWIDSLLRRGIDILASALGLLLLSPIFAVLAFLIRRDTPGPAFYSGPRVGKGGKEFGILKFRTMYERPESYAGASVTAQDDERVTPLGRWLRDTKLNELPQLWNVLKGDMSLVGPRPEDPEIAAQWPADVREQLLSVRPGITSPASVLYREEEKMLSGNTLMADYMQEILPSKLRLDQLYVRNRNFLTDLDVIFWTAVLLLPRVRNLPVPEYLLYWGPLSKFTTRFLNWFLADVIISFLAIGLAGLAWRFGGPLDIGIADALVIALGMALLFSLLNYIIGLNNVSWSKASASSSLGLIFSAVLSTLILVAIDHALFFEVTIPFGLIEVGAALACAGFVGVRYRERLVTGLASRWLSLRKSASGLGERVLIVGAGEMGELASWLLQRGEFAQGFAIVGMVDDDPRKIGLEVANCKILGTTAELPELIRHYDVGMVVFAIGQISPTQRARILSTCRQTQARLAIFPDVMEAMKSSLAAGREDPASRDRKDAEFGLYLGELDAMLAGGDVQAARAKVNEIKAKFAGVL